MGRYYSLSRKLTEEDASKILEEMLEMEKVKNAYFSDDFSGITVFAGSEDYQEVMAKAVNIFSREGAGAELSFERFVPA